MPSRKRPTKPDDNTAIVRAVERVTDSGPVRGEDLLPPRLARKLRAAKASVSIARKRRMLNKKTLAQLLGVHQNTYTGWERREVQPTDENLDSLVRVLRYPKSFFFGPDLDEPVSDLTSFRSQKAMSAARREAALAAGTIGFRILDWVTERFELPTPKLPNLASVESPEAAARMLRQEWGLGEKPVTNMLHLLESKGVRVLSLAENTEKVNAYSLWRKDGTPYVFLNTFKSAECSRFDAAHELAHLVLHQDGSVIGRRAEDQANAFASTFLMPKSDILSALPGVQHLPQLIRAKARWGVSVIALTYRAHKVGLISDWKYRDLCVEISMKGYRKSEPNEMPREKSLVWEKVIKMLWAEKTTQRDIATALDIPVAEVSDLLFGVLNNTSPTNPPDPSRPLTIVTETPPTRVSA
jgi:Zn-dependent peptidase ImmA (M78 family)/transcriptional regulator with XRE-family HTH domain